MTQLAMMAAALGVPPEAQTKLNYFMMLFMKWNRSINLSGARTEDQIERHIVDCLHVLPHLRALSTTDDRSAGAVPPGVLDVGAGGGLPSVVAAICLPDLQLTALEPIHKKASFLRVAARELALSNLVVLAERLEHHKRRDYAAAMSRATFDLREWLLLGQSHVRSAGVVLGFEAVPRSDLPAGTQRHSYSLDGKARAIVVLQRAPLDSAAL